jgi:hypothetical protein
MSAADAFGEMDSGILTDLPDNHALEVTGVELGEMRVQTSRGPAQVGAAQPGQPAHHRHVDERQLRNGGR